MTYYIFVENNKINGAGQARIIDESFLNIEVSKDIYSDFINNPEKYLWDSETKKIIENENYEAEQLQKEKEIKIQEATEKAYAFEQTDALITVKATNAMTRASDLYHIEGHFTNMIKISAYAQSLSDSDVIPWNTKENINILLDKNGCVQLSALMQQMNNKLWTIDFASYISQIEAAQTIEEVTAINIEYLNPDEVVDLTE